MEKFRTLIEQDETDPVNLGDQMGHFYTGERAANYGFPFDYKIPVNEDNIAEFVPPENAVLALPVYGLSHSGMSISLTPFGDKWDSAQIGFYVVEKEQAKFWFGENFEVSDVRARVDYEIGLADSVLRGEVYTVILEKRIDESDWQTVESLSGIIGYDQAEAESAQMLRYKQVAE